MSHNPAPVNTTPTYVMATYGRTADDERYIAAAITASKVMQIVDTYLVDRDSVDAARWRDTESEIFKLLS